jgi:nitrous oxidase accessory protein NosD
LKMYTNNVEITGFTIRNATNIGIHVSPHTQGSVIRNNIITNTGTGIFCWQIDNIITIIGNTISNNSRGIVMSAAYALIYHNNIINNTIQVEDPDPAKHDWHHPGSSRRKLLVRLHWR